MVDRGGANFVALNDPIGHSRWGPCEEDVAGVRGGDEGDIGGIGRNFRREWQGGEEGEEAKREREDECQQQ